MLPKRIASWVLILIWVAGTLPYIVVTFWPWDPVFSFSGNDKVGKFFADSSLAFSTAFPFWFVIEWFQRRARRREVAQMQRALLDALLESYHRFLDCMLVSNDPHKAEVFRNKALTYTFSELKERMDGYLEWEGLRLNDGVFEEYLFDEMVHFGHSAEATLQVIRPYQLNFTVSVNKSIELLEYHLKTLRKLSRKADDEDPTRLPALLSLVVAIRDDYIEIENHYRKENGLGKPIKGPERQDPQELLQFRR